MSFTLSHHAREEMARRGLPLRIVEEVLANPQQKVPELRQLPCYQSKIDINQRPYLIRLMVDESTAPAKVVTAYRTSKIAKYWRTTQ
jgi:hypothetical protein